MAVFMWVCVWCVPRTLRGNIQTPLRHLIAYSHGSHPHPSLLTHVNFAHDGHALIITPDSGCIHLSHFDVFKVPHGRCGKTLVQGAARLA